MTAPLLKLSIHDTAPGMDARIRCTTFTGEQPDAHGPIGKAPLLLAELHPASLPTPDGHHETTNCAMPGAMENGWPGFFHRAHRFLRTNGILLLATRQRREAGVLTDPLGSLIASARTAGFRYLQHIVIAHAYPVEDQLVPASPDDGDPGVVHSDLIVLSAIHHA